MVVKTKKPLIEGIEPLRKEVEALRGSEEKYKTLVAASQDAIVEVDEKGRIILWNKGAERIFGYSAEEILNQPVTKLMVEKHRERHRKGFESFLNENRKIRRFVEGEGLRKDGSRFPIEWSLSSWRENGKNMVAAIGKDVSALNKAESKQKQAEELYTAFANSSQIAVYIVQDRRFQFVNPQFQSHTGFSQDELLGIDPLTIVHPEDREMVRENAVKMLKRERFSPYEFRAVTKGGETRWVMETVISIQYQGKRATLGNYMDVSERKQVEEALQEAERRYRAIFDNRLQMVYTHDEQGRFLEANDFALERLGYTQDDFGNVFFSDIIHPDDLETAFQAVAGVMTKGYMERPIEIRILSKSGEMLWIEVLDVGVRQEGEHFIGMGIARDITEQKQAEEALRESQERYMRLYEGINEAVSLYKLPDLRISHWNKRYEDLHKLLLTKDIESTTISDIATVVEADDWDRLMEDFAKMSAGEPVPDADIYEIRMKDLEGKRRVLEVRSAFYKEKDQLVGIQVVMADITERKRAEEALRQSEENYRALFDSAVIGTFIMDAVTMKVVMGNQAAAKAFGFDSVEEAIGVNPFDLIPPDDRERVFKIIVKDMFEQDLREANEFRVMTKGGREVWVSAVGTKILHQGRLAGLVSFTDITERKNAEGALQESEEKWRSLAKNAPNIIMVVNRDGKIEFINRAVPDFDVVKMIGKSIYDYAEPEYQNVVKEILEHVFQAGGTGSYEARWVGSDGGISWYETQVGPIEHDGRVVAVTLISTDITERKNAEKRLKSSFVNLAETISRAVESRDPYTAGHQRGVAELAQLVGERMGLDNDRLQGLYMGGLLHDIGKVSIPASILSKPGALAEEEWALIRAHPKQGYRILKDTNLPWPVADMALHHHERLDGSGYPHGISGGALSLEVRILAVCDVVEAMGSYRPYRPAKAKKEVLRELRSGRGTKYDASVVDVVLQIVENGEFDFAWNGRNSKSTATEVLVH
jgi:PAS domain S-box-containing protein